MLCDFWVKVIAGPQPQLEGTEGRLFSASIPGNNSSSQNRGKKAPLSPFWRVRTLQYLPEAYAGLFEHLQYRGLRKGEGL